MLCMSKVQGCPDPAAFQRACVQLFVTEADIHGHAGIDLDKVRAASSLDKGIFAAAAYSLSRSGAVCRSEHCIAFSGRNLRTCTCAGDEEPPGAGSAVRGVH